MKTIASVKTTLLSALFLACGLSASAEKGKDLIYNSEEVNGLKVAETVYKADGNTLSNYMKYNYTYDEQNRMTKSEALKWDSEQNKWVKDICIRHTYNGQKVTTTYYKWDEKKGEYILSPEMTATMVDPNL